MSEIAGTLLKHRRRLTEVARVLSRHGLATWAARAQGIAGIGPVEALVNSVVTPADIGASDGARLRAAFAELGTTFIKFGQMLSLRPDVVGQEIADELAELRASVPADAPGVAQKTVETQFGSPVSELFEWFEAEPFASGSIAQIHRAALRDGTAVAVKVMHERAGVTVREDLALMRAVAAYLEAEDPELALFRPTILVAEFAAMMGAAIDLRQELANLQRFRANFAGEPDVVIPAPRPELCGEKVLTMAMVSGCPFSDRASVEGSGWQVAAFVQRLAQIYLEMIFRDGLFHADPHPGNFLLPDGAHLAILDFGDVGRLGARRRAQLQMMLVAIGARDVESVADALLEMTAPPPGADLTVLRAGIETWFSRYALAGVGQIDVGGMLSGALQLLRENKVLLPADLAILFRVLIRLQGLGQRVGTEVPLADLLQPYISEVLAERFDPRRVASRLGRSAHSWERLTADLPDALRALLDQARAGKFGVEVQLHDTDHAVDNLVDGMVAAAALLAGAQLISNRARPLVGPLSFPGLVAAGVGAFTWQRLATRRQPQRSWVGWVRRVADIARH
jgi:ubiquinone biosynthesis protein